MVTPTTDQDPLVMAHNAAQAVYRYAAFADSDDPDQQLQAYLGQAGRRGHEAAKLAANLALVSMAGDLRRLVDDAVLVSHG